MKCLAVFAPLIFSSIPPERLGEDPLVSLHIHIPCQLNDEYRILGYPIKVGTSNTINLATAAGVSRMDECLSPTVFAAISGDQFDAVLPSFQSKDVSYLKTESSSLEMVQARESDGSTSLSFFDPSNPDVTLPTIRIRLIRPAFQFYLVSPEGRVSLLWPHDPQDALNITPDLSIRGSPDQFSIYWKKNLLRSVNWNKQLKVKLADDVTATIIGEKYIPPTDPIVVRVGGDRYMTSDHVAITAENLKIDQHTLGWIQVDRACRGLLTLQSWLSNPDCLLATASDPVVITSKLDVNVVLHGEIIASFSIDSSDFH